MKLSVVIPAYNEEGCLRPTVEAMVETLRRERIPLEVLVINDNSTDSTEDVLKQLCAEFPEVRYLNNHPPHGYGHAVVRGLENFTGDAVAICMADASDDPEDLVAYYRRLCQGFECVFGTRWSRGGQVYQYPQIKRVLNRLGNHFIKRLMQLDYDDFTNAFKMYRREVIDGAQPIFSHHFNLTVELPLKAMIRGYSWSVVPNTWTFRKAGVSKLKIEEMGSRYLFIVLYCFLEKWLSKGDYKKFRR